MVAASPGSRPPRRTTLSWRDSPRMISTLLGAMPHASASSLQAALFALPSAGGAVTRTITTPSRWPAISLRRAPGCTRTFSKVSGTAGLLRDRAPRRRHIGGLRCGTARFPSALDGSRPAALAQPVVERLDTLEDQLGGSLLLLAAGVLDLLEADWFAVEDGHLRKAQALPVARLLGSDD